MTTLSAKEKLVLERLGAGKKVREIAKEMDVTLSTVYTHCDRARYKLGVHNTEQAVLKHLGAANMEEARRRAAASEGVENP